MEIDSLFDSIPSHWKESTLGEICKQNGGEIQIGPFGSQLHAEDYVADGVPSIMPQNIGDNYIDTADIARVSAEDVQRLRKHVVREGDIG